MAAGSPVGGVVRDRLLTDQSLPGGRRADVVRFVVERPGHRSP